MRFLRISQATGLCSKIAVILHDEAVRITDPRILPELPVFDLLETGGLYPAEISGGMMKRTAIARAIALNPKYLFCDEPNSGLDPKTALLIDDLIHDITIEYNMTTVINTHDMNSVMNIGEKIIFINDGKKEWEGTKEGVMNSTNIELNDFVFASDLFKKVKQVENLLYEEG